MICAPSPDGGSAELVFLVTPRRRLVARRPATGLAGVARDDRTTVASGTPVVARAEVRRAGAPNHAPVAVPGRSAGAASVRDGARSPGGRNSVGPAEGRPGCGGRPTRVDDSG